MVDLNKAILGGGSISNAPSQAEQQAALQKEKDAAFNPANAGGAAAEPPARRRIPLSVPRRKLECTPIPGYVLYWFKESNITIAQQAGYDFVDNREVTLNQGVESSSSDLSGNTDLGSRVSVLGGTTERGHPERLVLMKIREDWWREDRKLLDNENAAIIHTIFGGQIVAGDRGVGDHSQSYVKTSIAQGKGALFNRGLKKVT